MTDVSKATMPVPLVNQSPQLARASLLPTRPHGTAGFRDDSTVLSTPSPPHLEVWNPVVNCPKAMHIPLLLPLFRQQSTLVTGGGRGPGSGCPGLPFSPP